METRKEQLKWKLAILLIAVVVVAGASVATAEVRYHMVLIPDIEYATAVSDSGVILVGSILMEPARAAAGNPVWDSNGDGVHQSGDISGRRALVAGASHLGTCGATRRRSCRCSCQR